MQPEKLQRILIVNPYGIGDVLFMTPLIANLKRANPEAKIDLLLGSRTGELFDTNPHITAVCEFDKGAFDKSAPAEKARRLYRLIKKLRANKYQLLIDLSNSSQYGFMEKYFLNIPIRAGFNYRGRGRYLTHKAELEGYTGKHVVRYYLDILKVLDISPREGPLELYPVKEDIIWVEKFMQAHKIAPSDLKIALSPGGGSSWGEKSGYKHWSWEKYGLLANRLISEMGATVILTGDSGEIRLCRRIKEMTDAEAVTACGETSILELAALYKSCQLVICNDGGPLHIAVSQGTPTISIFGPVDERVYGPYDTRGQHVVIKSKADCRPCYQKFKVPDCPKRVCLDDISVDEVYKAAAGLLESES